MKLISVPKWWNARWNARNRLKSAMNPVNGDLIRQATPAFLVPTKE
jgi:hypothetical protein